ncbi:MAG TPA: hypothetical protein VFL77_04300 [Solirubrobacterales bacterium]|nr:hypothetical protein [Solirubrobacterales bacterium]
MTTSKDAIPSPTQLRGPEIGPALKRDRLLQRVRAARKRLPQAPSNALARLR